MSLGALLQYLVFLKESKRIFQKLIVLVTGTFF